jgi:hypothetical protein
MVVVPAATPVITPEEEPMLAMLVLALVQLPPAVADRVVLLPTQTVAVPEIAEGAPDTVKTVVLTQPALA